MPCLAGDGTWECLREQINESWVERKAGSGRGALGCRGSLFTCCTPQSEPPQQYQQALIKTKVNFLPIREAPNSRRSHSDETASQAVPPKQYRAVLRTAKQALPASTAWEAPAAAVGAARWRPLWSADGKSTSKEEEPRQQQRRQHLAIGGPATLTGVAAPAGRARRLGGQDLRRGSSCYAR